MLLKYIKTVRSKGKLYYYFDTGKLKDGKKLFSPLPCPASPDFGTTYAILLGHRNRRAVTELMRVPKLVDLFQRSQDYGKLSANTRRLYDIYLARLVALMPTAPVAEIARSDMQILFDGMGKTPGAANLFLATSSAMFKWALARDYIAANPCAGIVPMKIGEHEPWPVAVLEAGLASDDNRVRLLVHLLFFTAQRIGDVLAMTWNDVGENHLRVKQQKTGKVLMLPLHDKLRAELKRTLKTGITIAAQENGKPWAQTTARQALKEFAATFNVDRVPHGIRKNAVISLLECGCSVAETAAISGQTLQLVEYYAKERNQTKLADAAVLRWQGNTK